MECGPITFTKVLRGKWLQNKRVESRGVGVEGWERVVFWRVWSRARLGGEVEGEGEKFNRRRLERIRLDLGFGSELEAAGGGGGGTATAETSFELVVIVGG